MAAVEGFHEVHRKLMGIAAAARPVSVSVGYTQHYAIYVHENMEVTHKVGQAKYLEQPARELAQQISQTVIQAHRRGATFQQALVIGGLFLQRESQKLVPVDTGALKNSAFTEVDK